jgi:hypothetical protein
MNPKASYTYTRSKGCAGKGCPNEGKIALCIKYLRKVGYFCDTCTAELLQHDLVTKESDAI